ncbi:HU family DNA-binding protein [Streptomyces sp. S.PNR 29]|uniref:HU family DNA-binding protein n=1 Tax=Streptomyces sp. S.PNR 29 TaxID=2973805 RepID=UPI0025B0A48F|nr:HU family DNA-binding protein [Streptomyces sp. S.PNR 29]MDN0193941.1 HU family DNA-binding protein [Streptomyces sp. S.PNR 29]
MNKAQLIKAVADKGGRHLTPTEAVEIVLDVVVRAVVAGDPVSVTGFGSLTPRQRPARQARNPQTGAKVTVPASRVVKFRPGARFQDLLDQRLPMPESGNCIQKAPKTPRP